MKLVSAIAKTNECELYHNYIGWRVVLRWSIVGGKNSKTRLPVFRIGEKTENCQLIDFESEKLC
jgi:hypothetical protein